MNFFQMCLLNIPEITSLKSFIAYLTLYLKHFIDNDFERTFVLILLVFCFHFCILLHVTPLSLNSNFNSVNNQSVAFRIATWLELLLYNVSTFITF